MRPNRRPLAGLLALNAALLLVLGGVALAPKLHAQVRNRSTYAMVSGSIRGQVQPVLFVADEGTAELVAVSWDDQSKTLVGMGYRNLASDANEIARTRN